MSESSDIVELISLKWTIKNIRTNVQCHRQLKLKSDFISSSHPLLLSQWYMEFVLSENGAAKISLKRNFKQTDSTRDMCLFYTLTLLSDTGLHVDEYETLSYQYVDYYYSFLTSETDRSIQIDDINRHHLNNSNVSVQCSIKLAILKRLSEFPSEPTITGPIHVQITDLRHPGFICQTKLKSPFNSHNVSFVFHLPDNVSIEASLLQLEIYDVNKRRICAIDVVNNAAKYSISAIILQNFLPYKKVQKMDRQKQLFTVKLNCDRNAIVHYTIPDSNENLYEWIRYQSIPPDVCLTLYDGSLFHVHSTCLSRNSRVFKAMLTPPTIESKSRVIQLRTESIDSECVSDMIMYMYGQLIPNLHRTADRLIVLADMYEMEPLKLRCEEYLATQISGDNCVRIEQLASLYSAPTLLKAVNKFNEIVLENRYLCTKDKLADWLWWFYYNVLLVVFSLVVDDSATGEMNRIDVAAKLSLSDLFERQAECDVYFEVGNNGNRIGAHQEVLFRRCPSLGRFIFEQQLFNNSVPTIRVVAFDYDAVRKLLKYIYDTQHEVTGKSRRMYRVPNRSAILKLEKNTVSVLDSEHNLKCNYSTKVMVFDHGNFIYINIDA